MYAEDGLNGHLDTILFPIQHGILCFTGFSVLPPFVAWAAARAPDAVRKGYLDAYAGRLRRLFEDEPIRYPRLDEYDASFQRKKQG